LTVVPRNLLRDVARTFGRSALTIASLRSIYQRSQTLYKHQAWAKAYLGMRDIDADAEAGLLAMLDAQAREAPHPDELETASQHWLYERRIVIPGKRRIEDWAREAFAAYESQMLRIVSAAVPSETLKRCTEAVYAARRGGTTHFEWLKVPSKRHGPTTLADILEKVRFLKELGVHLWQLDAIALPKLRAYAQKAQARRPAKTRELKESTQTLELVCFLRMCLLELTDVAMYQTSRRSQDHLFRQAANKAKTTHTRSANEDRQQALKAKAVLLDDSKGWRQRVLEAQELLAGITAATQASFASHVRSALTEDGQRVHALLAGLKDLDFGGKPDDLAFELLGVWRDLQDKQANALPEGQAVPEVGLAWHDLVHDADRKRGFRAFEACTMMSLRKSLRRGSVWIDHSLSFRERDQMLIPPDEWARERETYRAMLGLPATADEFVAPLLANLGAGMAAVAEAYAKGKIEIGIDGMLHLPAIVPLDDDAEPRRTRDTIYKMIGDVQFPDMLLDVDAWTNFSELLLGHRAESIAELLAVYGALLAHGTDIDAKGVAAMIPGIDAAQVSVAMRALEGHGRLRRANERVAEFQGKIPIAAQWGDGDKASADMMSLDASRHLWSARVDPRRRTYAAGIYTHVVNTWGVVYDQPIVLNERQAGVAIEGVEQHNRSEDRIRLSLLAVDTHGYAHFAMTQSKLLGFDLCPRLADLNSRKLHVPIGTVVPAVLQSIVVCDLDESKMEAAYDELVRIATSIRIGQCSAVQALHRYGADARGQLAYDAGLQLGMMLCSIYLIDYFMNPAFRGEIQHALNRGVSMHTLQRAIHDGQIPNDLAKRDEALAGVSSALSLMCNIVMAWNAGHMQAALERIRAAGEEPEADDLRRIAPTNVEGVNLRGTFDFPVERYAERILPSSAARPRSRQA
jgi:TnpA family transposase